MGKYKDAYNGVVEEVHPNYALVIVNVEGSELSLQFPKEVMAHYDLFERGKRFKWYPSKNGEVNLKDIEPRKTPTMNDEGSVRS